jgi:hypothetical protein
LYFVIVLVEKVFTPNATFKVNAGANPFKTPKKSKVSVAT